MLCFLMSYLSTPETIYFSFYNELQQQGKRESKLPKCSDATVMTGADNFAALCCHYVSALITFSWLAEEIKQAAGAFVAPASLRICKMPKMCVLYLSSSAAAHCEIAPRACY